MVIVWMSNTYIITYYTSFLYVNRAHSQSSCALLEYLNPVRHIFHVLSRILYRKSGTCSLLFVSWEWRGPLAHARPQLLHTTVFKSLPGNRRTLRAEFHTIDTLKAFATCATGPYPKGSPHQKSKNSPPSVASTLPTASLLIRTSIDSFGGDF
jgi:hypothetical protein